MLDMYKLVIKNISKGQKMKQSGRKNQKQLIYE